MSLLQAIDKKNIFVSNPENWIGSNKILMKYKSLDQKHAGYKKCNFNKKIGVFKPEGILEKSYTHDPHRIQNCYIKTNVVYNDLNDSITKDKKICSINLDHPISVKKDEKTTEIEDNIKKPLNTLKNIFINLYKLFFSKPILFNIYKDNILDNKLNIDVKTYKKFLEKENKEHDVSLNKNSLNIKLKTKKVNNFIKQDINSNINKNILKNDLKLTVNSTKKEKEKVISAKQNLILKDNLKTFSDNKPKFISKKIINTISDSGIKDINNINVTSYKKEKEKFINAKPVLILKDELKVSSCTKPKFISKKIINVINDSSIKDVNNITFKSNKKIQEKNIRTNTILLKDANIIFFNNTKILNKKLNIKNNKQLFKQQRKINLNLNPIKYL